MILKDIRIKTIPEDFLVEEISTPNFDDVPNQYKYILSKKGFSTFDAIDILSKSCLVPADTISYCGLKDEEGITKQEITCSTKLENYTEKINNLFDTNDKFIKLHYIGKSSKCFIGNLEGNAFTVTLRNIEEKYIESFESIKKKNIAFLNYYDYQRFGIPGYAAVTHMIGKKLLEKNYDEAVELFKISGNKYDINQLKHPQKFFSEILDSRKTSFFKNAYSSYLWNQKLESFLKTSAIERVTDDSMNIEYIFVKNLMDLLTLESEIEFLNYKNYKFGEERVSKRNTVIHTNITCSNVNMDDIFKNRYKVKLHFVLPSGCYATTLIRQLCTHILYNLE